MTNKTLSTNGLLADLIGRLEVFRWCMYFNDSDAGNC